MAETGIEENSKEKAPFEPPRGERIDRTIGERDPHLHLIQVVLRDGTDACQELVSEREWLLHPSEKNLALKGNLFILESRIKETGSILIRTAPLPHGRHSRISADLRAAPDGRGGWNLYLMTEEEPLLSGQGWTVLTYAGGREERTAALQKWQRSLRPDTARHGTPQFLSNTWGDRSRDSRINESFLAEELGAAEKLGVEVFQLDDGWQQGITSNSAQAGEKGGVWSGFWNRDPDFWEVNRERLPHGLEPVIDQARERGMEMGLWYNPDSWKDYAQWERDAARIIELHRMGVNYFKIDGIKAPTRTSQANLASFFKRVEAESRGEVVFDLDITAGIRPGYWGAPSVGPLFVENRYTDWHNYWPHQTLRNLWSLSSWVDPRRLRMEFLNVRRNEELYRDDPLAPSAYQGDTLFATVMAANPLGWFEVSRLPGDFIEKAAPLIALWKEHRDALYSGTILPIGRRPDGWHPTGFLFLPEPDQGVPAYLLVFRGLYEKERFNLDIPDMGQRLGKGRVSGCILHASRDGASLTYDHGRWEGVIKDKLGFFFARMNGSPE